MFKLAPEEELFDYDIKCTTPKDYELNLILRSNTRIMDYVFKKAKKRLKAKQNIDLQDKKPEDITAFEVPDQYYNIIRVSIKSVFNKAHNIFKKDGIILLNYRIEKVKFVLNKKTNLWEVSIDLSGIYSKK